MFFNLYLFFHFLSLLSLNLTSPTCNGAFLRFLHGLARLTRLFHYYSVRWHPTLHIYLLFDNKACLTPGNFIIVYGQMRFMMIAYWVLIFIVALRLFLVSVWFWRWIYATWNDYDLWLDEIFRCQSAFPGIRLRICNFHGFFTLFAFFLFLSWTFFRGRHYWWALELLYHQLREVLFVHLESHLPIFLLLILPIDVHCYLQYLSAHKATKAAFMVGFQVVAIDREG